MSLYFNSILIRNFFFVIDSTCASTICCNALLSKQLQVLSNPNLLETLTLLTDEDVREGLKRLKHFGHFGIESVDKTNITETPNASASGTSVLQPTVSNTKDTTAPEPLSIKIENEHQGGYMSEEPLD